MPTTDPAVRYETYLAHDDGRRDRAEAHRTRTAANAAFRSLLELPIEAEPVSAILATAAGEVEEQVRFDELVALAAAREEWEEIAAEAISEAEARAQVRAWRNEIGWSEREAAAMLDISDVKSFRRYLFDPKKANQARPMPARLFRLMRAYVFLHRKGLLDAFLEDRGPR